MSKSWGPWRLDIEQRCLYITRPTTYDISLSTCTTKASVLGWITHMAEKGWVDDATLAGLARAMHDLFDLHATAEEPGEVTTARLRYVVDEMELHDVVAPLVEIDSD